MLRRIVDEVVLPRIGRGTARTEPVEIAGRALIELESPTFSGRSTDATATSYLYLGGDTVWWLTAEGAHLTELLDQLP